MNSKKSSAITPVRLRVFLCILLIALAVGGVGLFFYGQRELTADAEEVSNKRADAVAASDNLTSLQSLQSELEQYNDVSELVRQLTSSNDLPQFQALNDLQAIARRYNVPVGNFSFVSNTGDASQQPTTPTSQNTAQLSFDITQAIPYRTLLDFLNAIEQNTPKLELTGVSLPDTSSSNSVQPSQLIVILHTT